MSDVPQQHPITAIRDQITDKICTEGLIMPITAEVDGATITFRMRITDDGWDWVNE